MTFVSNSLALAIFLDPSGIQNATSKTNLYLGKDTLLRKIVAKGYQTLKNNFSLFLSV